MRRRLTVALTAAAFLPATLLLAPAEADACSPPLPSTSWTLPEDGDAILPETPLLVAINGWGFGPDDTVTLTSDFGDLDVEVEYRYTYNLFTSIFEVLPTQPLVAGDHLLEVAFNDTSFPSTYDVFFDVDPSIDPGPLPGPVSFTWYQETLEQPSANSCYSASAIQYLTIEPLDDAPYFYEIAFHRDGDDSVLYIARPGDVDNTLRSYGVPVADCVEIRAIGLDGEAGDSVEYCQPHKCAHTDNSINFADFGDVNWDDVDGCGDEEEEENGEEEEEENDEEEENGEEESASGGCSTTGSNSSSLALALLLVGLVILRRRS